MTRTVEKTYWNGNGEEQAKYNEMLEAEFEFTKKSERLFHSYYRYYNDGDLPGWARGNYFVTQDSYRYGYWHRELNEAGEREQEQRVTEAILKEYKRFQKKMGERK